MAGGRYHVTARDLRASLGRQPPEVTSLYLISLKDPLFLSERNEARNQSGFLCARFAYTQLLSAEWTDLMVLFAVVF
jgi:hypothetical protein